MSGNGLKGIMCEDVGYTQLVQNRSRQLLLGRCNSRKFHEQLSNYKVTKNPVSTLPSCCRKLHFNNILPSTTGSFKMSLPFMLIAHTFTCIFPLSHASNLRISFL